jgi:sensor histidine kinase YesM
MSNTNPIFRNYQSKLLYSYVWLLLSGIQIVILQLSANLPFEYTLAETLVFNSLFACYILPLWYAVRFNTWRRITWHYHLITYFLLGCLTISVWLASGYFVVWLFISENEMYLHFLQISLWWKAFEGFLLYILAILMYRLYTYVIQLHEKANNEIRLTKLLKDGELNLLKSQINPHFLFNGLNSVNATIVKNPAQAQKMLVALSDYLHYTVLSKNRTYATLQEEMENIERYLAIEKLRFGDKLIYEHHIDPSCLVIQIPAMLLQPLFENAIKHGVYESLETVHITTTISQHAQMLCITISNNYDVENPSKKKGAGAGLQNIKERLALAYSTAAGMETRAEQGKFTVVLNIPIWIQQK